MKPILTGAMITLGALGATMGTAVPAGPSEPFRVRIVTMNGQSGPAYYSNAVRAYRFIAGPSGEHIAALVPAAD